MSQDQYSTLWLDQKRQAEIEAMKKPKPSRLELFSNCCGSNPDSELDKHYMGRCPDCGEGCEFTDENDNSIEE